MPQDQIITYTVLGKGSAFNLDQNGNLLPPNSPPGAQGDLNWDTSGTITLDLTAQTFVAVDVRVANETTGFSFSFDHVELGYLGRSIIFPGVEGPNFRLLQAGEGGGSLYVSNIYSELDPNPFNHPQSWQDLAQPFASSNSFIGVNGGEIAGDETFVPQVSPVATPEPAAWLAMVAALVIVAGWRKLAVLLAF